MLLALTLKYMVNFLKLFHLYLKGSLFLQLRYCVLYMSIESFFIIFKNSTISYFFFYFFYCLRDVKYATMIVDLSSPYLLSTFAFNFEAILGHMISKPCIFFVIWISFEMLSSFMYALNCTDDWYSYSNFGHPLLSVCVLHV